MQLLRLVLFFSCLVSDATDLGLDLEDLIVSLVDELLDRLERLVTLLHAKQTFLPVLEQGLLAHDDSLNFNCCLLESVTSCCCLFLLRDELGLVECLLFVESLDLLVHRINE